MVRRISAEQQPNLSRDYSQMTLTEIARSYLERGDLDAREELASLYQKKINRLADYFYRRNNKKIDLDDLISEGNLAFTKSIEKYDPTRGCFENYIDMKIRGSMSDYINNNDSMSMESKERLSFMREFSSKFKEETGFLPSYEDYQREWKKLDLPDDRFDYFYFEVLNKKGLLSLNCHLHASSTDKETKPLELGDIITRDARLNPKYTPESMEVIELFERDMDGMKERDKHILMRNILDEVPLKIAGQEVRVSESTASFIRSYHIKNASFRRLREHFGLGDIHSDSKHLRKRRNKFKNSGYVLNQSA